MIPTPASALFWNNLYRGKDLGKFDLDFWDFGDLVPGTFQSPSCVVADAKQGSIGENKLGDCSFFFLIFYSIFLGFWGLYYSKMAN